MLTTLCIYLHCNLQRGGTPCHRWRWRQRPTQGSRQHTRIVHRRANTKVPRHLAAFSHLLSPLTPRARSSSLLACRAPSLWGPTSAQPLETTHHTTSLSKALVLDKQGPTCLVTLRSTSPMVHIIHPLQQPWLRLSHRPPLLETICKIR